MVDEKQIEKTEQEKDQAFVHKLAEKFKPKDLIRETRKVSNAIKQWSFACNLLSLLAAVYFVYYITLDYTGFKKVIPLIIFSAVLIAIEIGKRYFSITTFEHYFSQGKRWMTFIIPVVILSGVSIVVSSFGGDKFVKNESGSPKVIYSLKIDTLKGQIALLRKEITLQKQQTWGGKIVTDSRKLIKEYEQRITKKENEISTLESEDKIKNTNLAIAQEDRLQNWGLIFGLFVGSMDLLLIFLLGRAEFLEHRAQLYLKQKGIDLTNANFTGMNMQNIFGVNKVQNQIGFKLPSSKKTKTVKNNPKPAPAHVDNAHTRVDTQARTRTRRRAHAHARARVGARACKNPSCKNNFQPKSNRNKYCSKDCREKAQSLQQNA